MSILHHIRHISFDVWNTLIIPNLEFSTTRNELIAEVYDIPFEQAKATYTQTKRFLDTAAELTGFGTSCTNVYRLLNAQLKNKLSEDELVQLRAAVDCLFDDNLPTLPRRLVEVLIALKERDYTLSILSNTNFVGGQKLMQLFNRVLGQNFFDYALFSDEHDMAKPHFDFFHKMSWGANSLRDRRTNQSNYLSGAQILHIGDNLITDIEGAKRTAVQSLLVKDPYDTARQLQEALDHA